MTDKKKMKKMKTKDQHRQENFACKKNIFLKHAK